MRKIYFVLAGVILLLSACASMMLGTKYRYSYDLTKPTGAQELAWQDDKIKAAFQVSDAEVDFRIVNKTSSAIKVIWDEASIIQFGKTLRIMHVGVKYADRNGPQLPSVIPPGVTLEDMALPTDNVYYREGYYGTYVSNPGGWERRDLFATTDLNKEEYKAAILGSKGQTIDLYLPIEIDGQKIPYDFQFTVSDVVAVK